MWVAYFFMFNKPFFNHTPLWIIILFAFVLSIVYLMLMCLNFIFVFREKFFTDLNACVLASGILSIFIFAAFIGLDKYAITYPQMFIPKFNFTHSILLFYTIFGVITLFISLITHRKKAITTKP